MDAFSLAVRYARPLRWVPALPFFFDAALRAWTTLRHPSISRALDQIEREALSWPGVTRAWHRFGGVELRHDGRELGHLHGHGLLDAPLTRDLRRRLVADGRARPHHIYPSSGWISYAIHGPGDISGALALLRVAYERTGPRGPG